MNSLFFVLILVVSIIFNISFWGAFFDTRPATEMWRAAGVLSAIFASLAAGIALGASTHETWTSWEIVFVSVWGSFGLAYGFLSAVVGAYSAGQKK